MALLRMLPYTQEGFEHVIITLTKPGSLAPEFEKKEFPVIALHKGSLINPLLYFRLRKTVRQINPDLIVTHLLHADIVGRLFLQYFVKCRLISSLVTTYNSKRYWPASLFEKITGCLAQGYMANSQAVKNAYVKRFCVPEKKITVVPCGIDTDLYKNQPKNSNLRKTLGVAETDFLIICVANLLINKGHLFLLESFEKFFTKHPEARLLLVGQGPYEETIRHQLKNYSSKEAVFLLGKRNDVPELLATADTFILATFFEGMSNAIMEAMASRLPIITTNIEENQELITDHETGLLCPPGDSAALDTALEVLFKDSSLRTSLGQNAALLIEQNYALPQATSAWTSYYATMSQPL